MLWTYRLLFLPALALAAPYYLLRMKRRGGYGRNFTQRFGAVPSLPPKSPAKKRIWLQAVSVGEMLAIAPLLEALKREGRAEVYLSTTTSTGYELARQRYREHTIGIGYFPVDWWAFSRAAWARIAPDLVILTEGERWPEHIHQAASRGVPVLCINARLSDRSYRRMRRWPNASTALLKGVTRLLACSAHDAERFRELGVPEERLSVTGNIKLDLTLERLGDDAKTELRAELGFPAGEAVLLGSSTWPGEEEALVRTLARARAEGLAVRLLIVPRHAERRAEIESLLQKQAASFSSHFRSRGRASRPTDIAVADTTGELRKLTQVADLVFVGKSLPPHEQGQTPVEAAAAAKPLLFGPGMTNFRAIAAELTAAGAASVVRDPGDLARAAVELLRPGAAEKRATMARAAEAWHKANQGAVERTLAVVRTVLTQLG